jgi:glycolate oxidase iron-sulfur subunit
MLLGGLLSGELDPSARLNEMLYSCLLCGMCESGCPVGVRITEAVYQGREWLARTDGRRRLLRAAAGFCLKRPMLSFKAARLAGPLLGPLLKALPYHVPRPETPLRQGLEIFKPEEKKKGRVAVFTGCLVNYVMPSLGLSLINVLLSLGFEVVLPAGEVCCGAPLRALGLEDEARELARKNMLAFGRLKADAVLSLCPTCTLTLKGHYPVLIDEGLLNAMDVTEFLPGKPYVESPHEERVIYHDPCHLRYGLGIHAEPRKILASLGSGPIEPGEPGCCGFSVGLTHRELSAAVLEERTRLYKDARTVVTACPGCIMQLGRAHPNVRHIIELVEEAAGLSPGVAGAPPNKGSSAPMSMHSTS